MVSVDQAYMVGHMKNADGSINNKNVVLSAACEAAELFQCMMAVNQKLEDWQRFNHTLEMHLRSVECEKIHDICQGLEFSDGDSIYIIGGAAGQKPGIAKLTGSGSSYKYSCLVTATHNNFGGNAESEGIQLKGDYVYFGISDKQSSDKACIYSIPKSAF